MDEKGHDFSVKVSENSSENCEQAKLLHERLKQNIKDFALFVFHDYKFTS